MYHDKRSLLNSLASRGNVELELGCGDRKRCNASIGVDVLDYPCVDIVGDLSEVLRAFPTGSVDRATSHHVFEHLSDLETMFLDLGRIIKVGGKLEIVVPHFSNPYYFSDSTHKTWFGLYSMCYFASGSPFQRKVPTYQRQMEFQIETIDLIFKSSRPFYCRYALKRLIGFLFNLNVYMRELYEENFCGIFPCYELRYVLIRVDPKGFRS